MFESALPFEGTECVIGELWLSTLGGCSISLTSWPKFLKWK